MEQNIIIRDMTAADITNVSHMMADLHRIHRSQRPDIYIETDKPFVDSDLMRGIDNPDRITLVAEKDGVVAGLCVITNKVSQNPLCIRRKIAFIEAIYVREDMRRCGIGSVLYDAAVRKARDEGADSIELVVGSFNKTALRFYERMGMRVKSNVMETKL